MREITITITKCRDCPDYYDRCVVSMFQSDPICCVTAMELIDEDIIPEWCPKLEKENADM